MESLLFSAGKLRQAGWISDPAVQEPLIIGQCVPVMDFRALGQVLGIKGPGWGGVCIFQDGFHGIRVNTNPK